MFPLTKCHIITRQTGGGSEHSRGRSAHGDVVLPCAATRHCGKHFLLFPELCSIWCNEKQNLTLAVDDMTERPSQDRQVSSKQVLMLLGRVLLSNVYHLHTASCVNTHSEETKWIKVSLSPRAWRIPSGAGGNLPQSFCRAKEYLENLQSPITALCVATEKILKSSWLRFTDCGSKRRKRSRAKREREKETGLKSDTITSIISSTCNCVCHV